MTSKNIDRKLIISKPKGFFEKIFIVIISQATYIYMQSESAVNELKKS